MLNPKGLQINKLSDPRQQTTDGGIIYFLAFPKKMMFGYLLCPYLKGISIRNSVPSPGLELQVNLPLCLSTII